MYAIRSYYEAIGRNPEATSKVQTAMILAIANFMVEFTDIDQLWFVVTPQNPHKTKVNLLDDFQRLEMVHRNNFV